jgi:hypothetical protein
MALPVLIRHSCDCPGRHPKVATLPKARCTNVSAAIIDRQQWSSRVDNRTRHLVSRDVRAVYFIDGRALVRAIQNHTYVVELPGSVYRCRSLHTDCYRQLRRRHVTLLHHEAESPYDSQSVCVGSDVTVDRLHSAAPKTARGNVHSSHILLSIHKP